MANPTWNPSDKSAAISLSNGNLTATATNTSWKSVRATDFKDEGKLYWEVTINQSGSPSYHQVGIGTSNVSVDSYVGVHAQGFSFDGNGYKWNNNSSTYVGPTFTTNDIISVAVDLDGNKFWVAVNGVWVGSGDPANGSNELFALVEGASYAPMHSLFTINFQATVNFGATSFAYSMPSGFSSFIGYDGYFDGYVYEQGSPVQRILYLHNRDNGELVDTTTSSGNGYYYLTTTYSGSHYIVCLDDESGANYNDLIIGNIIPTTISG